MHWKNLDLPTRLNLLGVIILLVGLGIATWIYQQAGIDAYGVLGYVQEGGVLYPINPEDSKSYLRGLELYGGKANVLVDEFRRWFGGLWQGKSLAIIVGCTATILSLGLFYTANYLIPRLKSAAPRENKRDGTD